MSRPEDERTLLPGTLQERALVCLGCGGGGRAIHLFMQGKGGCGKSFCAWCLLQYVRAVLAAAQAAPGTVLAVDTDPLNQTLSSCRSLEARHVPLHKRGATISAGDLDELEQELELHPEARICIVDVGSAVHMPLIIYMSEGGALELWAELGFQVFVHAPLCGGEMFRDTAMGMQDMMDRFGSISFVLWHNQYFGEVLAGYRQLEHFVDTGDPRLRQIQLPRLEASTMLKTLRYVLNESLSFEDFYPPAAAQSEGGPPQPLAQLPDLDGRHCSLMDLLRIRKIRQLIFTQIEAGLTDGGRGRDV